MTRAAATIVCIGCGDAPEFVRLAQWLAATIGPCAPVAVADIPEFEAWQRRSDAEPQLVIVWQNWSDEYSAAHVARLLAAAPLAQIVCVCGPWCEADGRTRKQWPAALRTAWWEAPTRLEHACRVLGWLSEDAAPQPWTGSREEMLLAEAQRLPTLCRAAVCVVSADPAYRATLESQLRERGCAVVAGDETADVCLIDADPASPTGWERFADERLRRRPTPCVALTAWPTGDVVAELTRRGAADVLCKLAGADAVAAAVNAVVGEIAPGARSA